MAEWWDGKPVSTGTVSGDGLMYSFGACHHGDHGDRPWMVEGGVGAWDTLTEKLREHWVREHGDPENVP